MLFHILKDDCWCAFLAVQTTARLEIPTLLTWPPETTSNFFHPHCTKKTLFVIYYCSGLPVNTSCFFYSKPHEQEILLKYKHVSKLCTKFG